MPSTSPVKFLGMLALPYGALDAWAAAAMLNRKWEVSVIYYVFRPTTGRARMVTDDKIGAKLPKRRTGEWIRDSDLEIIPGGDTLIGASADDVIAGVQRDGYYLWLEPEPAPPTSK